MYLYLTTRALGHLAVAPEMQISLKLRKSFPVSLQKNTIFGLTEVPVWLPAVCTLLRSSISRTFTYYNARPSLSLAFTFFMTQ